MNLKVATLEYVEPAENTIIAYQMMMVMGVAAIDTRRTTKEHRGSN